MKILRLFSKEVEGKKYYKYTVTLPKVIAEQSGLLDTDLKAEIKDEKIIIEKA
jgi:hypothetical protein